MATDYKIIDLNLSTILNTKNTTNIVQNTYNIVDCTTVDCSTIQCNTINCTTINCSTVQCTTVNCTTVDCTTVKCNYLSQPKCRCYSNDCKDDAN